MTRTKRPYTEQNSIIIENDDDDGYTSSGSHRRTDVVAMIMMMMMPVEARVKAGLREKEEREEDKGR